ncbi:MAG: tetratricopeptide repeat protein [Candidatus Omnitrophota bacterium]
MNENINLHDNELFQKGQSAIKKRNFAYAIEIFQNLLLSYPNSLQCQHYLWQAIRENKKINPPSLLNLIFKKTSYLFLVTKSEISSLSNNFNQAKTYLEQIILINPDDTRILYKLATIFIKQQQIDKAIFILEELLIVNRYHPAALKSLMQLYFETENFPKAKLMAKLVLELNPHQLDAENILKDISALGTIEKGFDDIKPAT